ncbi:hypothetical protein DFH11DRAFT_1727999 [Phellopilus nigrolimitatus]|nr:hypothetical protein DFH11DRAFT_1727999 [Phellopilus nigrolimitatus]
MFSKKFVILAVVAVVAASPAPAIVSSPVPTLTTSTLGAESVTLTTFEAPPTVVTSASGLTDIVSTVSGSDTTGSITLTTFEAPPTVVTSASDLTSDIVSTVSASSGA